MTNLVQAIQQMQANPNQQNSNIPQINNAPQINTQSPVLPQQTQQSSWVQDLINTHSNDGGRIKRTPIGFNFQSIPFDPSSFYRALDTQKQVGELATNVTETVAANKAAAQQKAALAAAQKAAQEAVNGITPRPTNGGTYTNQSNTSTINKIISLGMNQVGKQYVFGAEGPNTFDCSGLTQYLFRNAGIKIPRTAAEQQRYATPVSSPKPGDLVFFGRPAHHVGLYLGNGQMLAAPHTGAKVRVQSVGSATSFGRI